MSDKKVVYCLIFWTVDQTYSIIDEPEELKLISNGAETEFVERGISYKIKVLARSGNFSFIYFNLIKRNKNL